MQWHGLTDSSACHQFVLYMIKASNFAVSSEQMQISTRGHLRIGLLRCTTGAYRCICSRQLVLCCNHPLLMMQLHKRSAQHLTCMRMQGAGGCCRCAILLTGCCKRCRGDSHRRIKCFDNACHECTLAAGDLYLCNRDWNHW